MKNTADLQYWFGIPVRVPFGTIYQKDASHVPQCNINQVQETVSERYDQYFCKYWNLTY